MIVIDKDRISDWLKLTDHTQQWLAQQIKTKKRPQGIGKAYLSQILNNKCKIYTDIIDQIIQITGFRFEAIFKVIPGIDDREFYPNDTVYIDNELVRTKHYKKRVKKKFGLFRRN